jgi:hypothetical protein
MALWAVVHGFSFLLYSALIIFDACPDPLERSYSLEMVYLQTSHQVMN